MDSPELSRVVSESNYCAGIFGNVVVCHWREKPTEHAVGAVSRLVEELVRSQPAKIAFLAVAATTVAPPDAQARDAFAHTMRTHAERIAGAVLVIEGTGLRSAALRAVATAISLLGGAGAMPQPFATVAEATDHLAKILAQAGAPKMSAAALAAAVDDLRHRPVGPPARASV